MQLIYYHRTDDHCYRDLFEQYLENKTWAIQTRDCYVVPQEVVARVSLTNEQLTWYRMADESVPHMSLAVHVSEKAKDLGPMVRSATRAVDWQDTQLPEV